MTEQRKSSWFQFMWRISSSHMISYFIMGVIFSTLLNYKANFATAALSFMRPIDSPWVAAGPSLQVFRGILFALVLWPIQEVFLKKDKGWVTLWMLFLGLAILGTAGPTPGSFEGIIYTKIPIGYQLFGLPEVVLQTLLFSLMVFYWYKKPSKKWNIFVGIGVALIVLMSLAGVFLR